MLKPSKHDHPDQTALHLATVLVQHLRARRIESYATLRSIATSRVRGGEALFGAAIDILFLLGLLDYQRKSDSFEYTGPEA